MAYPVQHLIEGCGEPTCVLPTDPVSKALELMMEHDYSQLPVVNEARKPLGMITYESILGAQSNFGLKVERLLVKDATDKADSFQPEDDLFDLLDRLRDTNAVLIVDGEGRLIGIVTSYDSNEFFQRRAEDMMRVEGIETMIKELIQAAFTDEIGEVDEVKLTEAVEAITGSNRVLRQKYHKALCHYLTLQTGKPKINHQWLEESFCHIAPQEKPKAFDELTLYEYIELLLYKSRWGFYEPVFNLEPGAIRHMLDGVRKTRNALAHFRGEISPSQRDQLRFCAQWLDRHQVPISVSWPVYVLEQQADTQVVRETPMPYEVGAFEREIIPTEEALSPRDSKYAPLAIWLNSRPSREDRVQLDFQQVEEIIGGDLPLSARQHRAWWANDPIGHVQSLQWLDVGWRVAQLNMAEGKVTFARIRDREMAYIEFFSALQAELREKPGFPLKKASPGGQSWLTVAILPIGGPQLGAVSFSFARGKLFRIDLYIDTGEKDKNKQVFDELYTQRAVLEAALGAISWERIDDRRASRIAIYCDGHIMDDSAKLTELREWGVDTMVRFYDAIAQLATKAFHEAMGE